MLLKFRIETLRRKVCAALSMSVQYMARAMELLHSEKGGHAELSEPGPASFHAAGEASLDASLAATACQRLAWLEEALAFAYKAGALRADLPEAVKRAADLALVQAKEKPLPPKPRLRPLGGARGSRGIC
jgi:hypothetical protein